MKSLQSIILIIMMINSSIISSAQQSGVLYDEIAKIDSLYFAAQNDCDLEKYAYYLSEDFEFFHDKGGFTASKDDEMKAWPFFVERNNVEDNL